MSLEAAERIARAVLYEGYLLYPYTPDAVKNRQRWTFGGLYPKSFVERYPGADASELRCECLLEAAPGARVTVRLRFLQLVSRESEAETPGDKWEEAIERELVVEDVDPERLSSVPERREFEVPGGACEDRRDGFRRIQRELQLALELSAERLAESGAFKLRIDVRNVSTRESADRRDALLSSPASTHLLLSVSRGGFISLIDPGEKYREPAARCVNRGTWPVLVGNPGDTQLLLAAPIILHDYPQVAPESPGDLFDGGEIDEILSLRILTLAESEKSRIRESDERGREMLERTEGLSERELSRMHGAWRDPQGRPARDRPIRAGTRVRIRPRKTCDVMDVVLSGMTATVERIEQDMEGGVHLCLAIDEDPGRDLEMKAQLGHRFFFRPEDVELL